jgi:hypothetical protein
MFRKLEALALIVRADALAVNTRRRFGERLILQPTDHLAMFQNERHFVRANLQYGARALPPAGSMTEAGIEKTGIMNTKFSN